jgi:hypothetical protein
MRAATGEYFRRDLGLLPLPDGDNAQPAGR